MRTSSPGPYVILVLTSPESHVLIVWQVCSTRPSSCSGQSRTTRLAPTTASVRGSCPPPCLDQKEARGALACTLYPVPWARGALARRSSLHVSGCVHMPCVHGMPLPPFTYPPPPHTHLFCAVDITTGVGTWSQPVRTTDPPPSWLQPRFGSWLGAGAWNPLLNAATQGEQPLTGAPACTCTCIRI